MSDLHDALVGEAARREPQHAPPFAHVLRAHRARTQRRAIAGAAAAVVVLGAGTAVVLYETGSTKTSTLIGEQPTSSPDAITTPAAGSSPTPSPASDVTTVPVCDAGALAAVATGGGRISNGFNGTDIELTNTGDTRCLVPERISSLAVADATETHDLPIEPTASDHGGPQVLAPGGIAAFTADSEALHGSGSCLREAPTALQSPKRLLFQLPGQPAGSAILVALPDDKRFTIECWPVVVSRMRVPDHPLSGSAPNVLWPATGDTPAAGACGGGANGYATVETNPDVPLPRCLIVTARERLRVVNTSNRFGQPGRPVLVTFAGFAPRRLAVGEATVFDRPFGEYLATGVHTVHLSLFRGSGTEVWLKG
jgi:hypothetical protein